MVILDCETCGDQVEFPDSGFFARTMILFFGSAHPCSGQNGEPHDMDRRLAIAGLLALLRSMVFGQRLAGSFVFLAKGVHAAEVRHLEFLVVGGRNEE